MKQHVCNPVNKTSQTRRALQKEQKGDAEFVEAPPLFCAAVVTCSRLTHITAAKAGP